MLNEQLKKKIQGMIARFHEVEKLLVEPDILSDKNRYKELTQEHSYLGKIKDLFQKIEAYAKQLQDSESLLKTESDPELIQLVSDEIARLSVSLKNSQIQLETLLIPPDPRDNLNVVLEIRAGTGGDEAALFVGDCVRMYQSYADQKGWKYESLSATPSERGGFKEYIMAISGHDVFRLLQYEAGIHRVQRVPSTETLGRVHTSAITVAALPEPTEEEKLKINPNDLRIETYRSSGAGGQHVNKTNSAVRITHIPTNTVVTRQEERSQHRNLEAAMRILATKIAEEKRRKDEAQMASLRSSQVGSGDRSEKIRTYNFPQNRVTDHRIDLTLYNLASVLDGSLDEFTQALVAYFYEQRLQDENHR